MSGKNDVLSPEGIRTFLSAENKNCPIFCYEALDSTNNEAKLLVQKGAAHQTVILADSQSAGRGRSGKSFFSPPTTGIYMSVILRPEKELDNLQLVTVYTAVAVCKAIERLTVSTPKIKWVNDIYIDGKKVCGILTELVGNLDSGKMEAIVVGIGVNCFTPQEELPAEICGIAGSLCCDELPRNRIIAAILEELLPQSDCRFQPDLVSIYRAYSLMRGKEITYHLDGVPAIGVVTDIDNMARLVVNNKNGAIDVLRSGEVSIKSKQGW